jgi:tetratricopeptide (TPR) repeat protein
MKRLRRRILTAALICLAVSAGESTAQNVAAPRDRNGLDPAFELTDKALQEGSPNAASQRDRNDPDVIIALTTNALRGGRLDQPRQALALADRGGAYLRKMQYDLAIADLTQAIEIDPSLSAAFNARGAAYQFQGKYDLATDDYSHAIMLDARVEYLVNRGIAYRQGGKYDLAIADYSEVIRRVPNHVDAHVSRAFAYMVQGQFDAAIADYTALIRLGQTTPTIMRTAVSCLPVRANWKMG